MPTQTKNPEWSFGIQVKSKFWGFEVAQWLNTLTQALET